MAAEPSTCSIGIMASSSERHPASLRLPRRQRTIAVDETAGYDHAWRDVRIGLIVNGDSIIDLTSAGVERMHDLIERA